MTDSTPTSSSGTDAADDSRLTVEDAGSTTDPADLAGDAPRSTTGDGSPATAVAADRTSATSGTPADGATGSKGADGLASLQGDDVGHVFDQTNGVVEGLDGDSDGTVEGEDYSTFDRAEEDSTLAGRDGFVEERRDQ